MVNLNTVIFIILFTSWSVSDKLDELSETAKDSDSKEQSDSLLEFKDTPLHLRDSYRHKHKNKFGTKHHYLSKRAEMDTEDTQCAVLYKNNAPIGILQPFEDSYKFLAVREDPTFVDIQPLSSNINPVEDTFNNLETNKEKRSNRATFSVENYPFVFTKFQLHNRKDLAKHRTMSKREDNKNLDDTGGNSEVEGKLKSLLDDMGLLNDYLNEDAKRDAEDENLELGTNKIDLIKDGKTESRVRRYEQFDDSISTALNGTSLNELLKGNENLGLDNSAVLSSNNDTKITIKSPEDKDVFKRSNDDGFDCKETNSEGSHKVMEYEKRVEREIRDKIKKIKEEVTKEMTSIAEKEDESKRKKRQTTNTLLDEENKDIDPNFHSEENQIHIRKKRSGYMENYGRRLKREVSESQIDNDDEEEFNGSDETDGNEKMNEKADCYCSENNDYCECSNNEEISKVDEEEMNSGYQPEKYSSKKSVKQLCSCDKSGNHCKCSNNNQNFDYYEDVNNVETKNIEKKSIKQSCTCDKNGVNCKCDTSQFLDSTSSIDTDYYDDNSIGKRSIKARKYADVKPFQNGEYLVDFQPEVYKLESIDNSKSKRDEFNALLDDSDQQNPQVVKQKSMLPLSRYRRRIFKEENDEEPRKLTNMSEEDLFGALPQSFGGELARYKRVRRNRKKK